MQGRNLGPYRLDRELGSGGMGTVYAATVEGRAPGFEAGTRVALKIVHPHLLETPGYFMRFLREAEIGRSVVHENVVRTHMADALVANGVQHHFLVMEYVEGQTLRALLDELERVPEELGRHIGREVAKGLAAIHAAGAVHRDLKPENLLITADHHTVKVMDLGVARLAEETIRLSQSGAFVGSVEYAAPEQFGSRDVGASADLHALGVVLYELATAQHPYRADDFRGVMRRVLDERPRRPAEVNPQLSPFFEELVLQLLDKDPARRIASAGDLAQILEEGERSSWWREKAASIRTATKGPLRRIRIPRETALYGRDIELARLRVLYDEAKSGEGQVLLVEGEAGIGKSRLLDEFVGLLRLEGEDLNFLSGSYPPGGAATASGSFSTAYREHFGSEALEETLPGYLVETPVLVPAFAALLRGETTPTGAEPLTKDSLQTVFVHATRALARERTTIVLIEDLHFSPEEGRALFASLALATPGHRVLLVGTARPGVDERWFAGIARVGAQRMTLARLGPKDLFQLLQDAFHSEALAHELAGRIAVKSDGNPFFAFEILRGLREGQLITRREDGKWVTTRVIGELAIPSSVLELVHARVADLSERERELLDVASCWGFEFDPGLVGEVVGERGVPLLKRLAKIEHRHRLIRSSGRNYAFDHHQVQEALYGSLHERMREEYHAALASALEQRTCALASDPASLDGALCVELAEHHLRGAQGQRALRYLDSALAHLEAGYMNDAAVRLADRALAIRGLVSGQARCELLVREAKCLDILGRHGPECAALDEARELLGDGCDDAAQARVLKSVGWRMAQDGRNREALHTLAQAWEAARRSGNRVAEAWVTGALGSVHRNLGDYAEAKRYHRRRIALARAIGDRRMEAASVGNLAIVLRHMGRLAGAHRLYERSIAISREVGDRLDEAVATGNLGILLGLLGRTAEARDHLGRALSLAGQIGYRAGEQNAEAGLAGVLVTLGDLPRARTAAERSLALAREIGGLPKEASALASLSGVVDECGDPCEAMRLAERALELNRETQSAGDIASSLRRLGELRRQAGDEQGSRALLEDALAIARERSIPEVESVVSAHLAGLPGGSAAAAADALSRSVGRVSPQVAMSVRTLLWQATRDRTHLVEAKRLLDHLVEHAPPECRESMVTNVRLHREIVAACKDLGP